MSLATCLYIIKFGLFGHSKHHYVDEFFTIQHRAANIPYVTLSDLSPAFFYESCNLSCSHIIKISLFCHCLPTYVIYVNVLFAIQRANIHMSLGVFNLAQAFFHEYGNWSTNYRE